jgi:SAM-dependent methyltransferase
MFARSCPVCGQRVEDFRHLYREIAEMFAVHRTAFQIADFETLNERDYSCPHCEASDRERIYALWIGRNHAGGRLLDIGPTPAFSAFLRQRFDYRSLAHDDKGDDRGDIQQLPYADGSFDGVICSHVLEHVADDRLALREIRRVLRSDGWAIVMVPICRTVSAVDEAPDGVEEAEAWRRFGQSDHVRLYDRAGFMARATEAGLVLHQQRFGWVDRRRYGITRRSRLYVASVAASPSANA